MHLTVKGVASGSNRKILVKACDLEKTLLQFMREQQLPLASSCDGEQICQKCQFNGDYLACSFSLQQIFDQFAGEISIGYF